MKIFLKNLSKQNSKTNANLTIIKKIQITKMKKFNALLYQKLFFLLFKIKEKTG